MTNTRTKPQAPIERIIISGGGTGGHIFPALSIADEVRARYPHAHILFVGAVGKMETEKIPSAGYELLTLPVRGLDRKNKLRNLRSLWCLLRSLLLIRKELIRFSPQIVVGVGGFASAPTLLMANWLGIPTLIQEQNSYAGVTNKKVGKKARTICVAYDGMERFFPKERIFLTGNPVRRSLLSAQRNSPEAYTAFGLDPYRKTLLVIGGSLGARSINRSIIGHLQTLSQEPDIQVLWQTGSANYKEAQKAIESLPDGHHIHLTKFITRMDLAYSIADLVVSRAGAGSISEFSLLGLPVVLVPLPTAAEDHQTKNAEALVQRDAAVLIEDSAASEQLIPTALTLLHDDHRREQLRQNITLLGLPDAAEKIVNEIERIVTSEAPKK